MDHRAVTSGGRPSFAGTFVTPEGLERPCVVTGRSIDDLSITGGGVPAAGRVFACRVDVLGLLHARIWDASGDIRRLSLAEGALRRERIAARIDWHCARLADGSELRTNPRIVPVRTIVSLRWSGCEAEGNLLDVSAGGASVAVTTRPAVGDPITVGMRRGVVIRHTESGIALRFVLPLRPEDVREEIVL